MAVGTSFARDPLGRVSIILGVDLVNERLHLGTRERDTAGGQLKTKTVFANGYQIGYGIVRDDGSGRCNDSDPYWYDPWEIQDETWEAFRDHYKAALERVNGKNVSAA